MLFYYRKKKFDGDFRLPMYFLLNIKLLTDEPIIDEMSEVLTTLEANVAEWQ